MFLVFVILAPNASPTAPFTWLVWTFWKQELVPALSWSADGFTCRSRFISAHGALAEGRLRWQWRASAGRVETVPTKGVPRTSAEMDPVGISSHWERQRAHPQHVHLEP